MKYKDYYQIFGLPRDANATQIKAMYRRLARKYHPDVSKDADAEQKFKELGEAYAVLKDPEKRAAYDALGKDWDAQQDFSPPPNWDAGFEFSERSSPEQEGSYSDFFEQLFRASGHGRTSAASQDHHAKITIDIEDSVNGATRMLTLQVPEYDKQGRLRLRPRKLNVRIPKGITEGQHIRLQGQGAPSLGKGPAGDVYLQVAFNENSRATVAGKNLEMALPVTPWEAVLGGIVEIETPAGTLAVNIPKHSQSGSRLRIRGKGLTSSPPGDLILTLRVVLPIPSTSAATEAYENMRTTMDFNPRAELEPNHA